MCNDRRLKVGQIPVCADVCPTQAIRFGERTEMLSLAKERIQKNPEKYYNHIFGEEEAGGTSVMFIGAVEPEQLGLNEDVEHEYYPELTGEFLYRIPLEIAVLVILLGGILYFRSNRMKQQSSSEKEE
jgi:formate dehydrogenase iron-sulfur subunit